MKKVLKSVTVTSLVLSGGFLFGFSEQTSAASLQSNKAEISIENRGIASYEFSFYDLSDLRGTKFFTLTPGSTKNFLGDDDISSIKMPPSSSITLYSDLDYEGKKITIRNTDDSDYLTVNLDEYYIDGTNKTWNNRVGSLKTKRI
ncbi:hypothetical protein BHU24_10435 [Bacillus pseudomycoides]|uniref:Uncharacterized protein n=1 Tax=Bacillus pseudomycoides TaxID=64104 RepID=A0AAJ1Z1N6_9BACI|nr:hypothetical protein [Bacillus pseudomycoides]MBD5800442.1 hypothetical protein [Bacillus pseudomycoides]MDR4328260.1 hypothetical protein [Bacillus pseudomycoides]PEE04548.1 hypothetical protein CON86_19120 [Bacillus pseudomycoides]PEO48095.1 hypothetical protein CN559_12445 [Bacillus pseudomycoides]PEO86127.1 hypothetical protein CN571_19935 [Bacillus pseudomycoides]